MLYINYYKGEINRKQIAAEYLGKKGFLSVIQLKIQKLLGHLDHSCCRSPCMCLEGCHPTHCLLLERFHIYDFHI